jgi:DNA-binding response OmpR family regulator
MNDLHILLADDEKGIIDYLAPLLERSGYAVSLAYDGQTALQKIHNLHPDLIVLDILMPIMNGREVCRQLRSEGNWIPIIMLTCVSETADKVMSLEEGADDFICKPFEPQELIARIKAVLRRRTDAPIIKSLNDAERLKSSKLILDRWKQCLEVNGKNIPVSNRAFQLLEHLMLHPGQIFTREQLMNSVWGWSQPIASRAVDVRIVELRHALEDNKEAPKYIETVIGVGYRFVAKVEIEGNS